ncbi:MAG TPA: hypothetical protein VJP88_07585 [Caulobacteraceae bacterium]|nr:hypothetical protein [Caulobacteraceae bacterium]
MAARSNPWLRIGMDAWMLGLEASSVVALRTLKLAEGGLAGEAELRQMVTEKFDAALALQVKALSGTLGLTAPAVARKTLSHYRGRVRANRRRLAG